VGLIGTAAATYSSVNADGSFCSGAVTLQATAVGVSSFGSLNVAAPTITITGFAPTSAYIQSAANTGLSLNVLSNNAVPTTSISVALTTTCGQVTPNVATTDGNGAIAATYRAVSADGSLCQGNATITAIAAGTSATTTIAVAAPTTGSLIFVSAVPSQIFLSGSGANTQGTLTFKLTSSGVVQANQPIDFTLTGNPGGVKIGSAANTSTSFSSLTDSAGNVLLPVFAGGVAGSVTVHAIWHINPGITADSSGFTIASGPPQQKTISLSVDKNITAGADIDGDPVVITARVADANGNPVPDGTVVNFVSSGGQINRSCSTTTANGGLNATGFSVCSVKLISQAFRPSNGRVAVLAYLEGINNYVDNNGNGLYDSGDTLKDQGDAYRDDNENGQYDPGEFIITKGVLPLVACGGTGKPTPARANTCTGLLSTTVRSQIMILWSSAATLPIFTRVTSSSFTSPDAAVFKFYLNSSGVAGNLLPLPGGTTVSAKVLTPSTGCTATDLYPSPTANIIDVGGASTNVGQQYPFSVTLTGTPANGSTPAIVCKDAVLEITTVTTTGSGTSTWRMSNNGAFNAVTNPTSTVVP
jgi:hypothetical protein